MINFFKNIWSDIKQRKNLELYITLLVIIGVFLADILGVDTQTILVELVLATLAVLLYTIVDLRHTNRQVEEKLGQITTVPTAQNFFRRWDEGLFQKRFQFAQKELSLCAVANQIFIDKNQGEITGFLARGGKIRCLLVDLKSPTLGAAAERNTGSDRDPKTLAAQIALSIRSLKALAQQYPDQIEIRLMDHVPSAIITMVDPSERDGTLFITLNGFEQPHYTRPSMILNRADSGEWFDFYQASFEHMWKWEKTRVFEIGAGGAK